MIVKIRCENQWTYIADVKSVKTEETAKENEKVSVSRMTVFHYADIPYDVIELDGRIVYLLTDEGKTIERIN